jgi:hypothetical protein
MSHRLARKIFHAMLLNGPKLEKKQLTLKRIVDTTMFLFGMAAVLSRFLTRKTGGTLHAREEELVRMVCASLKQYAADSYRKIRVLPGRSELLEMSEHLMDEELRWLEDDICDVVGLSKVSKTDLRPAA